MVVWRERFTLTAGTRAAYKFWETATIITIILGMLTTILVAVTSTPAGQGDGLRPLVIRILAIVFPAVGTAAAAIVAFYGPQAEWSHASRTLATLSQLHDDMALSVWNTVKCEPEATDRKADLESRLAEWQNTYAKGKVIADAGGQGTGDTNPQAPKK